MCESALNFFDKQFEIKLQIHYIKHTFLKLYRKFAF